MVVRGEARPAGGRGVVQVVAAGVSTPVAVVLDDGSPLGSPENQVRIARALLDGAGSELDANIRMALEDIVRNGPGQHFLTYWVEGPDGKVVVEDEDVRRMSVSELVERMRRLNYGFEDFAIRVIPETVVGAGGHPPFFREARAGGLVLAANIHYYPFRPLPGCPRRLYLVVGGAARSRRGTAFDSVIVPLEVLLGRARLAAPSPLKEECQRCGDRRCKSICLFTSIPGLSGADAARVPGSPSKAVVWAVERRAEPVRGVLASLEGAISRLLGSRVWRLRVSVRPAGRDLWRRPHYERASYVTPYDLVTTMPGPSFNLKHVESVEELAHVLRI